ncbi:site-specific DNA-methyltransferase [Campylobacter upsaliensis]|uniref:site-specific DNA-methyltransferase n=1 Tax=Campylobacter upsaliensis TaxID=28080 RepID=UPI0004890136|nr:site-specific DNA-methyltransferase [Campylobacter upsaliensis]MCA5588303.1 site-specific DNA-methyltransferase [Campylobacter upsaliensis]
MSYQQAFFSKPKECYLGVRIEEEGERGLFKQSGFTNLLHIKQKYFENIRDYLEKEELRYLDYSKLYDFFSTYLNETGTPFFDEKEIYSFHFLTDDFIQNADNNKNKIIFYLQSIEDNELNIKVINDKNLNLVKVFKQNSSEFSEDFLKALRKNKIDIKEEELKSIFKSYKKQNEIDFFIHKNAKAFLKEQFDLRFCAYVLDGVTQWNEVRIKSLNKVKKIAHTLIDKIAAFEDELKAVWLKPKFVKVVNYVFSLDLILKHSVLSDKSAILRSPTAALTTSKLLVGSLENADFSSQSLECQDSNKTQLQNTALLDSICKDKGFEKQIKEWQDLKFIDESFQAQNISEKILSDDKYKFLPLDTKHFSKETQYKILSVFDDIESILNGELIKADNFQALNSLMPKYQNKVDLIYIDPPYNTGNDGFIYSDKFNHSSWLSMIANRLELAREFLKDSGSIFISIDDNEQARLKILCDEIFGEGNFMANIIWEKVFSAVNLRKDFSPNHDFISVYSKNIDKTLLNPLPRTEEANARYKNPDNDPRGIWTSGDMSVGPAVEANIYEITLPSGRKILPPKGYSWRLSKETFEEYLKDNRIYFNGGDSVPRIKRFLSEVKDGITPLTIWKHKEVGHNQDAAKEILALFDDKIFDTPKPERLLKRICEIASNQDSIILDFFAGSGTSVAAAQKLGRKWLGIEMGEHFYKVILPRLKKVIGGFQSGISKECDYQGSGAFRYYELESYEEALKECEYVLTDCQCENKTGKEIGNNAEVIYPAKDYQKAQKIIDYRKSRKLIKKLNKGETITLDMSGYRKEFDLFHTLANLQGLKIKRLFLDSKGIESCEFDNGDIVSLEQIDLHTYPKLKNLLWWEKL